MKNLAPEKFARDWIAAWNGSDAEAVLAHYADQTVFLSPLAAKLTGNPQIRGKAELRAYWTKALRARPSPPQFRLDSFAWDKENRAILLVYVSIESERTIRKCELMDFGPDGLICRGEAFVGSTLDSVDTTHALKGSGRR